MINPTILEQFLNTFNIVLSKGAMFIFAKYKNKSNSVWLEVFAFEPKVILARKYSAINYICRHCKVFAIF